jgi:dipeptidyl aminopeptidase/acylaminoacyl peptidase
MTHSFLNLLQTEKLPSMLLMNWAILTGIKLLLGGTAMVPLWCPTCCRIPIGAFMVANLLSHSDLFAAGIARSGAYNRTLTPFGFQSEERTYWDAPEIYYSMSPFMHADKMKHPLLLIHGEADNNSGTYPMQSERYFNALKGLGATVRLVILPKESHGYRAKESVLHLLWEQDQWLENYVKNRD